MTTVSPYTNTIRRVPVDGGTVTTLKSFSTTTPLSFLDVNISPSYVVYSYPNPSYSAAIIYSIAKSGGGPILLSNAAIGNGSIVGSYFFSEDTAGNVHRINLDGTGLITRPNSQVDCASLGGSLDWTYRFNPSTFRIFLSSISNVIKSYAVTDDISNPAVGDVIGTLPVNLNNFLCTAAFGNDMLAYAEKRNKELSYGRDILFLNATKSSSLKRLTNTNGEKVLLEQLKK
jgi:hypothetical protein